MSAYTTQAALTERYGDTELAQLTDRLSGTAIDTAVLDRAIAKASDEIDAYISARYALPLAEVPNNIAELAATITRFHLYTAEPPEAVRQRYDDAITFLRRAGRGEVSIGVEAAGDEPGGAVLGAITAVGPPNPATNTDRVFSAASLANFTNRY